MFSMIFNSTNFVMWILAVIICVTLWWPYIKGKTITAVVDGYDHPKGEGADPTAFAIRFMYREQKGGKRLFCLSKRQFDFKQEAKDKYPKGTEVKIRYFEKDGDMFAIILSDNEDTKKNIIYSIAVIAGATAIAVGYQLLLMQTAA